MRPRLLLDCDGILADFTGPCLEILSRRMILAGRIDQVYMREQVTHWDIMKCLDIPQEIADATYNEMRASNFCNNLPVFPGAMNGVRRLRTYADVRIVTSPLSGSPTWAWEREQWLKDHFDISQKRVVSALGKEVIDGDILVDDKTQTLVEWEKEQHGLPVQWVTPHNLLDGWVGLSTSNWDELLGIVEGYTWVRENPNE